MCFLDIEYTLSLYCLGIPQLCIGLKVSKCLVKKWTNLKYHKYDLDLNLLRPDLSGNDLTWHRKH